MERLPNYECIVCQVGVNTLHYALGLCVRPLYLDDAGLKPQTPRNPEVALVTNTLPCAFYFSWHVNTPLGNTNTVHIYIYLLHGNDTA